MSCSLLVGTIHYSEPMGLNKAIKILEAVLPEPGIGVTYLCIGSDLSTGDSFGPLTGTLLKRMGVPGVIGTLEETVHAKNLEEKLKQIPAGHHVVAIDATMGRLNDVGNIYFLKGPLRPGTAMNKKLPEVGDSTIVFNVAPAGFANFILLGCASLNKVWQGANLLARSICVVNYRRKRMLGSKTPAESIAFKSAAD